METPDTIDMAKARKSFFNRAAWISVFTPIVTLGVAIAMVFPRDIDSNLMTYFFAGAFCVQIASLILGIASLFGISKYGAKLILWKAILGIIGSAGMGIVLFLGMVANAMGGC